MSDAYRERRPDGWPLCPRCGEDELWSPDSTEAGIQNCLACHWVPGSPVAVVWLSFTPAYTEPRGGQPERLGAHAFHVFRTDPAVRSLCGYVALARAGAAADTTARRCVWCERVVAGASKDCSGTGRGWSVPS